MKKEARLLKDKSLNSLTLSIEHFNRPWDHGRTEAVLLFMDHSFEMLLKAAILHRNGVIRDKGQQNTIGFDECVRRGLSNADIKFLTDEQALALQAINGLRDAAQHHIVDLSEGHLYIQAQTGITLYRDLLKSVFGEDLRESLPERVLPIATVAPLDPINLFSEEIEEVGRLLSPGRRRRAEATARLRSLAIVDGAMLGQKLQPSEAELTKLGAKITSGSTALDQLFPGLAGVAFATTGSGPSVSLRITKKEGIPVQLVSEGTADYSVVGVKRVNELDFYNLRFSDVADKAKINTGQLTAMIHVLGIKLNLDYAKKIINTWCYSQRVVAFLKEQDADNPDKRWYQVYRADIDPQIKEKKRLADEDRQQRVAERATEAARRIGKGYGIDLS